MPAKLERNRGGAAAGGQAPQTPRVPRRGEQRGRGAGAGGDDMRVLEPNASAAAKDPFSQVTTISLLTVRARRPHP
jgi:hypothetical protein